MASFLFLTVTDTFTARNLDLFFLESSSIGEFLYSWLEPAWPPPLSSLCGPDNIFRFSLHLPCFFLNKKSLASSEHQFLSSEQKILKTVRSQTWPMHRAEFARLFTIILQRIQDIACVVYLCTVALVYCAWRMQVFCAMWLPTFSRYIAIWGNDH